MAEVDQSYQLVSRLYTYPVVNYVSDTVKSYYTFAKESNTYVKQGLETAESYTQPIIHKVEQYTHNPTIESILVKADGIGCAQLDMIEVRTQQIKDTLVAVKPKTIETAETLANKIHGTAVESILLKTVGVVDAVVDSLLPPSETEPAEVSQIPSEDPNLVDRTTPVIKKLQTRVSKDSIKRLPTQTYNEVKGLVYRNADSIPQVQYCIGMLNTASHKIHDVSANTQEVAKHGYKKGAEFSKQSCEYVYQSLNHMVISLTSVVSIIKRLDPAEAKATLDELSSMITKSKERFTNKLEPLQIKEDISKILQKAGDLLSQQVAAGYSLVSSSDNATIKKAVTSVENIIHRILESFQTAKSSNSTDATEDIPEEH